MTTTAIDIAVMIAEVDALDAFLSRPTPEEYDVFIVNFSKFVNSLENIMANMDTINIHDALYYDYFVKSTAFLKEFDNIKKLMNIDTMDTNTIYTTNSTNIIKF